ncbi:hypothetical protein [Janthinobacterium lividum]|uniref:hypothetical protein n=1 Tax=Janthinobacterium lividum TaxID=29581 RepID=UPI002091FEDF|nr:hypothetical protein [Janthinobacterium lividum]
MKWIKWLAGGHSRQQSFSSQITDKLVELEPFKTAITLNFVRAWPFVAYAVVCCCSAAFPINSFAAICAHSVRRWRCWVRLFNWIPRRKECGTPCQTCRYRCEHHAIAPNGKVDYGECFQCMDCVVIYASDEKCAPLMLEIKRARTIPIPGHGRGEQQCSVEPLFPQR